MIDKETNYWICRNCKRIANGSDWLQVADGENACVECLSRSVEEMDTEDHRKYRSQLLDLSFIKGDK